MNATFQNIMLVDDNDTDNFISKRIIEITGFATNAIVMNSGQDGLKYLEVNSNNLNLIPELIFLDINMPVVNGIVFVYEFEKLPVSVKEKCKIIVLSSSDAKRDIDQIKDYDSVVKYITKPLSEENLTVIKEMKESNEI